MNTNRDSAIKADELANSVDDVREMMRAIVAGLVADGFTDREARAIVAGVLGFKETRDDDA